MLLRHYRLLFQTFLLTACLLSFTGIRSQLTGLESFLFRTDSTLMRYAAGFEQSRLYLHTDKTIYSANEIIWFSAYVLPHESDSFENKLLYVQLLRNGDDSLIRSVSFLIRDNRSHGDILIPHFSPPGDYRLLAYTDKLQHSQASIVYQQTIRIRTTSEPSFHLRLRLADSSVFHPDTVGLLLEYRHRKGETGKTVTGSYELFGNGKRLEKGKLQLGYGGKWLLPLARETVENKTLRFRVKLDNTPEGRQQAELPVSYVNGKPRLRFFPEGGALVINTKGRLAIEAIKGNGEPLAIPIDILEGDQLLKTTQSNKEGVALCELLLKAGISYTALIRYRDQTYRFPLPVPVREGHSMILSNSVADDSIRLQLYSDKPGIRVRLLLHNFRQLFWGADVQAKGPSARLQIPSAEIPNGIYALTLVDEQRKPLAERLLLIRHPSPYLQVQTNKKEYKTRERIQLDLTLAPGTGDTIPEGSYSVSCTDINRVDPALQGNILHQYFIADQFDRPLFNELLLFQNGEPDPEKMEALLLTRGWRRYHWDSLDRGVSLAEPTSLRPGRGRLLAPPKRRGPYEVVLFNPSRLELITSDSAGHFAIPIDVLENASRRKIFLAPYKEKKESLKLWLDTLPQHVQRRMAALPVTPVNSLVQTEFAWNDAYLEQPFGMKVLPEVLVGTRRSHQFVSTHCNDYICHNYVLNCEIHPNSRGIPIPGEVYTYRFRPGEEPQQVEYIACNQMLGTPPRDFLAIEGIAVAKEFYTPDMTTTSPEVPEFLTTLYWNPDIRIRPGESFRETFFAGDTKGVFRITVEGITGKQPLHREYHFRVE